MAAPGSDHQPLETEGRVPVPGGEVWYGIAGQLRHDRLPLLVLHGGPGMNHKYLLPLADLADERPVIFYDQLDAGQSDKPNKPANWTVARYLREIDAVREALGLERVAVFGNSWGGTLAAAYAASRPNGLAGVILSSPLIRTKTWVADNEAYRAALPEELKKIMGTCETEGRTSDPAYEDAVNVFYRRHFCRTDPWPKFLVQCLDEMNMACYEAMWGPNEFTCTGVLSDYDGSDSLCRIDVPVVFTCGAYDEATPDSTRAFAERVPGAHVEVFAASSHMAFIEERDAYIASIRQFLNTLDTQGTSNE